MTNPPKARAVIKINIPEKPIKASVPVHHDQQGRRRDFVKQTLTANASAIQNDYGIVPAIRSDSPREVTIEIPLASPQLVQSDHFQYLLFKGIDKWANPEENELHIIGLDSTPVQDRRPQSSDLVQTLAEFQTIVGSPQQLRSKLKALEERLETAETNHLTTMSDLDTTSREFEKFKDLARIPAGLSHVELAVLTARKLGQRAYELCVKEYNEKFPKGLKPEEHDALALDKKSFVLTGEIRDLCSAENAGIDLNQTIEAIIAEADERSKNFHDSRYYQENVFSYTGACNIIRTAEDTKSEDKRPETPAELNISQAREPIVLRARAIKRDFEEQSSQWNKKANLAFRVYKSITSRVEDYDLIREERAGKLEMQVPLVAFAKDEGSTRKIYFVLPVDAQTANEKFTKLMMYNITHAARRAIKGIAGAKIDVEEALGTEVLNLSIPYAGEENLGMQRMLKTTEECYKALPLSTLGIKLKPFNLGEA